VLNARGDFREFLSAVGFFLAPCAVVWLSLVKDRRVEENDRDA